MSERVRAVNEAWRLYNRDATKASTALSRLQAGIGYAGFIHNFKNYVLRRDRIYLTALDRNFQDIQYEFAALRSVLNTDEEHAALETIERVITSYRDNIVKHTAAPNDLSTRRLDDLVKVDDTPALQALRVLRLRLEARSRREEAATTEALESVIAQLGFGVVILVLVSAAGISIIFYQRGLVQTRRILRRTAEEASAANKAKDEFLSSMSHELRTPLNAISGFAQLLELDEQQELEEYHRSYARHIRKSGDHLLSLINDILDLSKIETGNIPLSIETISISACIRECLPLIRLMAKDRNVAIETDFDPTGDELIRADNVRLKQIVLNLLSNAIKYGGINTEVRLGYRTSDNGKRRIFVSDQGPGIPAGRQSEIFEPFTRIGAENTGIEGAGIGLTVTKKLVELMNGTLGVDSEPGAGSTFWVEFPAATGDDKPAMTAEPSLRRIDAGAEAKILYVEDNPTNVDLMKSLISRVSGASLLTAHTGELGLELAKAERPNLIILDIDLPGMSGLDTLARLKRVEEFSETPIIALTAAARVSDIERGRKAGFRHYLTKPLDVLAFTEILKREIGPTAQSEPVDAGNGLN